MAFNQTTKQVTASINRIDAKKLRSDVQNACINVIGHAMEFGSSPLVETLTERMALSPMMKKLAPLVSAYLKEYGPFVHAKDTGWQFSKAKRAALIEAGYNFDAFKEDAPMWDDVAKAEKKAEPLDLFKELGKLADKAERMVVAGRCIEPELIPLIRALMGQYAGRKVVAEAQSRATTEALKAEFAALNLADDEIIVRAGAGAAVAH